MALNAKSQVKLSSNLAFGVFLATEENYKLFDLRTYVQKPLCGHTLDPLSLYLADYESLDKFIQHLKAEDLDRFNRLFIKTKRVSSIINNQHRRPSCR